MRKVTRKYLLAHTPIKSGDTTNFSRHGFTY